MIVGYRYIAMKITGVFHLIIGILCFIISMVGFSTQYLFQQTYASRLLNKIDSYQYQRENQYQYQTQYLSYTNIPLTSSITACIISLWIIMVGIIGILAGRVSNSESETRKMNIAYMVLAILSACIFSMSGNIAFSYQAVWILLNGPKNLHILFFLGAFAMFVEFVMAIVSSSICCCCSRTDNRAIQQNSTTVFAQQSTERNFSPATHYPPNVAGPYMPPQVLNEMK